MKTELLHTAVENLIQNGRKTLAERTAEAAHLTEREVDILRLMGNGDSNKIMAETLGITFRHCKKHVRNVIDNFRHAAGHMLLLSRRRRVSSAIPSRISLCLNLKTDISILENNTVKFSTAALI